MTKIQKFKNILEKLKDETIETEIVYSKALDVFNNRDSKVHECEKCGGKTLFKNKNSVGEFCINCGHLI